MSLQRSDCDLKHGGDLLVNFVVIAVLAVFRRPLGAARLGQRSFRNFGDGWFVSRLLQDDVECFGDRRGNDGEANDRQWPGESGACRAAATLTGSTRAAVPAILPLLIGGGLLLLVGTSAGQRAG